MGVRGGAKKQHGRGTGGPGTERGAKDAAGRDHSAEQIRFKKFRNEIGNSHGAPAEQIKNTVLAEAANAATGLEKVPEILGRGRINGGRCDGDEFAKDGEQMIERFG